MVFEEVTLTARQLNAADNLEEGGVIIAYSDGVSIYIETCDGEWPYIWDDELGSWIEMVD